MQYDNGAHVEVENNLEFSITSLSSPGFDSPQIMSEDRPMAEHLEQFTELVLKSKVVILAAETGAGKSTLAPAHLLTQFDKVMCTQPRRLLAHGLKTFVASELGPDLGQYVGVRTAQVQDSNSDTKLLFCTDGWAAQFLMSQTSRNESAFKQAWWPKGSPDVLVIDEAHEQNLAQELLLTHWREQYLCWKAGYINSTGERIPEPPRLVLMSATLGIEKLIGFLIESDLDEESIGYLSVPGRQFPIEDRYEPNLDIAAEVKAQSEADHEVLIFTKGKADITNLSHEIALQASNTEILALHRDLPKAQQDYCAKRHYWPRTIISTNIAESGATFDIDQVISTGFMKALMPNDRGGYCLEICECPKDKLLQQRGRGGRTKPGIWILSGGRPLAERDEMLPPEIKRSPLEGMALSLVKGGFSPLNLTFLNAGKTTEERFKVSLRKLKSFGYVTTNIHDGRLALTKKGEAYESFPIRFELSVFINELHAIAKNEALTNPALAADLKKWGLIIAAIVEVGRIHKRCGDLPSNEPWFVFGELANITSNDIFAQVKLFLKTHHLVNELKSNYGTGYSQGETLESVIAEKFDALHLEQKKYQQVLDMLEMMTKGEDERYLPIPESIPNNGTESRVVDCLIKAFKHELFEVVPIQSNNSDQGTRKTSDKFYNKPKSSLMVKRQGARDDNELYEIVKSTMIVPPRVGEIILGLPFSLEIDTGRTVHLLQFPVVISEKRRRYVLDTNAVS